MGVGVSPYALCQTRTCDQRLFTIIGTNAGDGEATKEVIEDVNCEKSDSMHQISAGRII